jgi:prolyl-tRNA synthetase
MFADWELIGVPHRITVGERSLKDGKLEYVERRSLATTMIGIGDVVPFVRSQLGR